MGCFVIFSGPFVLYMLFAKRTDVILWLLLIFAVFFHPVALLAVVRFDSASAFNPRLLIRSIKKTFAPYCGLVALFAVVISVMALLWNMVQQSMLLVFLHYCFSVYLLLVAAHLLGRFYWRYEEELEWET
jgi:multisubunit Na+/H+ antiporter MnhG subunit